MASAMAKGTFNNLAKVWASKVFPEPVGPSNKILDFANSTKSSFGRSVAPACTRL